MALITAQQVISRAFTRNIDEALIKQDVIDSAEWEYIRRQIGENLYNNINDSLSSYTTLIEDYIRPCLAYYVKYLAFDDIQFEMADRGVSVLNNDNATSVTDKQRTQVRQSILDKADILLRKLIDYIKKRHDLADPLYDDWGNLDGTDTEDRIVGGILIEGTENFE